jgi:hypothetical protein
MQRVASNLDLVRGVQSPDPNEAGGTSTPGGCVDRSRRRDFVLVLSKVVVLLNTTYASTMKMKPDDKERLLRNVIALRVVELEGGPETVGDVRDDLERLIGATVGRATAARVLGISQTALDRHIRAGSFSVVETPGGRYEVPTGELVSVAVELRHHASDRHPVAAVLEDRRQRAAKLTAAQLLPGSRDSTHGHRAAELRALAFHRAVALQLDRSVVLDAKRRLRRWQEGGQIDPRWFERWAALLDQPFDEIRRAISTDDEAAADLRQASPFAGTLSEPERGRILEIVRATA